MLGSPACGKLEPPNDASFVASRSCVPLTQRTESPKIEPAWNIAVPCTNRHNAFGNMALACSTTESGDTLPVPQMYAPPVFDELLQPRFAAVGALPHGQDMTPSTPGSQNCANGVAPYCAASMLPSPAASLHTSIAERAVPPALPAHATSGTCSVVAENAQRR